MDSSLVLLVAALVVFLHPFIFLWYAERRRNQRLVQIASLGLPQEQTVPLSDFQQQLAAKEREIKSKDLALSLAEQRLSKLDRAKFEFVSVTTHQLRTPLSAIKWTLHMMSQGQLGPITAEQKIFLDKCYESTDKAIKIVNELLKVDSIQSGDHTSSDYIFAPTDLADLLARAAAPLVGQFKERQIDFSFQHPPEPLVAQVDARQLQIVFENLLHNSLKYTKAGGSVRVVMSNAKRNSARGVVEITFSDTGIGIPEAEQSKIFQRFFRASNAVKLIPDGNGLGLAIAKYTVDQHGGQMWFESKENGGTTFHLSIPIEQIQASRL